MKEKQELEKYFDSIAKEWDKWADRNKYYHYLIAREYKKVIPRGSSILEIGCATGKLLNELSPSYGVGIEISDQMIAIAKEKYPKYKFIKQRAEEIDIKEKFDYIILSDLIGYLDDIYTVFKKIREISHSKTIIVINSYNFLWESVLKLGELFGIRMHQRYQNWLSFQDIDNILYITGFKVNTAEPMILFPKKVLFFSDFINKHFSKIPIINNLNLVNFIIAGIDSDFSINNNYSCTVLVPCRNEAGNIEACVRSIPNLGSHTEILFVDGSSTDGTVEKIGNMIETYKGKKDIKLIHQVAPEESKHFENLAIGKNKMLKLGKGDAVRKGFDKASGDILMILDADLCVASADLVKFYEVLASNKSGFVNGSRLVYRPEYGAMNGIRFLGNRIFSKIFSFLLNQNITDTLCGTKALFKTDYERIKKYRALFGDFDPFGDFELLFTATKGGLKIVDMPIWYQRRIHGDSKVSVFKHGILLFKMCLIGFLRFKIPFLNRKKIDDTERKNLEKQHGQSINNNAEEIWGWGTLAGEIRVKRRINEITEKINVSRKVKVLELGCGTGIFTKEFIAKNIDLVSFDISWDLINRLRADCPEARIFVGDAEFMPFNDASFDSVVGISVLHHLDMQKALKEINRVLKKGGKFIFSEPNMMNPQIFLQKNIDILKKIMNDTPTETAFLRWKLKKILQENGFKSIFIKPFDFVHPLVPKAHINFVKKIGMVLENSPLIKEISGSLLIYAEK